MLPYFHIGDQLIFSYPLILGIIWAGAYQFLNSYQSQNQNLFPNFKLFYFGTFCSAWIGAKLLFLLTVPEQIAHKAAGASEFWLGGGFVFYGGLIFGGVALILYKQKYAVPWRDFSIVFPVLMFGHALGRIACFLAGCCYGTHCDLPWSINLHGMNRHPVQLYEAISLFMLGFLFYKRVKRGKPVLLQYFASYSILRFCLEFFRGDKIRGIFAWGLSTSQLISLSIFIILLGCIFYPRKSKS